MAKIQYDEQDRKDVSRMVRCVIAKICKTEETKGGRPLPDKCRSLQVERLLR